MRRWILVLLVAALPLFFAASSWAGALVAGDPGNAISFSLAGATPLVFPGDGSSAGTAGETSPLVNATLQAGNAFAGAISVPLDVPPIITALSVQIGTNSGGAWTGSPIGGSQVVFSGVVNIKGAGGITILPIPIAAGQAGPPETFTAPGLQITVTGFAWTAGTLMITGLDPPTTTFTTTGAVNPGEPGSISLVAGARTTTNLAGTTFSVFQLDLNYDQVPEPVAPGLLLAGTATLGVAAWRKRKA